MTELNIEQLKAAALAATPGPWLYRFDPGNPTGFQHCVKLPGEFGSWVCDCLENADKSVAGRSAGERNADFIAAANPAAVLELITEVERLRSMQGSAEPVAKCHSIDWCSGAPLISAVFTDHGYAVKPGDELYTAPPAPVSAEPVAEAIKQSVRDHFKRLGVGDGLQGWIEHSDYPGDTLVRDPLSWDGELFFLCNALRLQSATPSRDAKDSFVSCYEIGLIKIQRVKQINGPELWAVRDAFSQVLSISGEWVYEPQPSERDDDFIKNHRFTSAQLAFDAAIAAKEAAK